MPRLGLTRVAYGCTSLADIRAREPLLLERDPLGRETVVLHTARAPRLDLSGGSLFWVVRHMLVARQPIVAIRPAVDGRKAEICLEPGPVAVTPMHCPSHQGWRYLADELWPPDLEAGAGTLPPELAAELGKLFLN